jgi:GNAT superfamily N-acetyltransferase
VDTFRGSAGDLTHPVGLAAGIAGHLGSWPPDGRFQVVGSVQRVQPGWDGTVCPAVALTADGRTVLSVPPDRADEVAASVRDRGARAVLRDLGGAMGLRKLRTVRWVYRWCTDPAELPEAGSWQPVSDPGQPDWLRPFGGEALVAVDPAGAHLGAVAVKRHPGGGAELAVLITRAARGQGLGRRLVAQAARRVLDEGAVPTYLHLPDNAASARLADAVGFVNPGWWQRAAMPPESLRARLQQLARRR